MTTNRTLLALSLSAALLAPAIARADVTVDVVGGSEITFEGLIQADGNWFHNDRADLNGTSGINGENSEFELRRAELVLKGKGPSNIEWVVGYDAKADKFLDTNARWKFAGDAHHYLQLGQFKQPNSLEELTSTKHNDFISKSTITNTYAVSRRLGAAYSVGTPDWSLTGSLFGRELTRHLASGDGYAVRGTFAPINTSGKVLHLGANLAEYEADANILRLRARPNADLATLRLVDTGEMRDVDTLRTIGTEVLYLQGPLKLQGEYVTARIKRFAHPDHDSHGFYASAAWNLTGEPWAYKAGVPSTRLPDQPARGMWQLAARYDRIDLDDGRMLPPTVADSAPIVDGVFGGDMATWTLGVNWFWRSNVRAALNYVKVDSERYSHAAQAFLEDNPSIMEARLQFYW